MGAPLLGAALIGGTTGWTISDKNTRKTTIDGSTTDESIKRISHPKEMFTHTTETIIGGSTADGSTTM